jgi:DNA-directed RNA polymerase specialized sigma24 family protein
MNSGMGDIAGPQATRNSRAGARRGVPCAVPAGAGAAARRADDLLKDVFQRAWQAPRLHGIAAAAVHLLKIADQLVCDRARQAGHRDNGHDAATNPAAAERRSTFTRRAKTGPM